MTRPVQISSLIVQTRPENLPRLRRFILDHGAEIPIEDPNGKIVCLLETENEGEISSFANSIAVLDGVLSANLVYHLVDEAPETAGRSTPAGAV